MKTSGSLVIIGLDFRKKNTHLELLRSGGRERERERERRLWHLIRKKKSYKVCTLDSVNKGLVEQMVRLTRNPWNSFINTVSFEMKQTDFKIKMQ
jgi:hypothetical protein